MLFGCLDIRWNTPSRVWCITSQCLDIRWNTPSRVSHITSLCSEIRWNTCVYSCVLCIVFVSLCKGNSRSNFESLPSHLSKYEDLIPLADRNRNNLLALARMNNYLYRAWCHIVIFLIVICSHKELRSSSENSFQCVRTCCGILLTPLAGWNKSRGLYLSM